MYVLKDGLTFVVEKLSSWYREHYRSFKLEPPPSDVSVIELSQLVDRYPFCYYKVGSTKTAQNSVFLTNPNLHEMFTYHFVFCTSTGSFDTG